MLLGIAVGVAGIVFVGQALARSVATIDDDALVLRGLGFTRWDRTVAGVLPHLLSAAVAVPVALAGAAVLSPRFPIGFARTVDPSVGLHIDWTVVVPGLVVLALLVVGGAIAVAWRRSGRLDTNATRCAERGHGDHAAADAAAGRPRHDDGDRVGTRPSQRARAPRAARGRRRRARDRRNLHGRARSRRRPRQPGAGRRHVGRHRAGGHPRLHRPGRSALAGVRPAAQGAARRRATQRSSDGRCWTSAARALRSST